MRKNKRNHLSDRRCFEVQGRLLYPRDGLSLWNEANKMELEALSNDAILLLIEPGEATLYQVFKM